MTETFDLTKADNPREIVVDLVARLAEGEIIRLGVDSGSILVGWAHSPHAVGRLKVIAGPSHPLVLAVLGYHQASDFIEESSDLLRRVMTRCWPGPLQLDFPATTAGGLLEALPQETRAALLEGQSFRLCSPKSPFFREIQKLLSGPVVLTSPLPDDKLSALIDGTPSSKGDCVVDAIVECGTPAFPSGPTVIRWEAESWKLLHEGAILAKNLERMSGTIFLFVCTGNTCRSPMAEGLFRKLLAESLQCEVEELPDRGYLVLSAGLAAAEGGPASPEGIELLMEDGVDIADHTSRQLTESLLDQADHVLTMTQSHRYMILASRPDLEEKVRVLSPEGDDVSDPIGGTMDDYRLCKNQIESYLKKIIEKLSPG